MNFKKVVQVGFEPTPPKRLELESSALDHSATEPVDDAPLYLFDIPKNVTKPLLKKGPTGI